jgi:hypothetical protein
MRRFEGEIFWRDRLRVVVAPSNSDRYAGAQLNVSVPQPLQTSLKHGSRLY